MDKQKTKADVRRNGSGVPVEVMCTVSGKTASALSTLDARCDGHDHWERLYPHAVDGGKRFPAAPTQPPVAPVASGKVEVGTWWKGKDPNHGVGCPYKQITLVVPGGVWGMPYAENGEGMNDGHNPKGKHASDDYHLASYEPIAAPPWLSPAAPEPAPSPAPRRCQSCASTDVKERIVGKAATRVLLCDPCHLGSERVIAPAGSVVEPPKATTWAPGCGPSSPVGETMVGLVGGWDRKVVR